MNPKTELAMMGLARVILLVSTIALLLGGAVACFIHPPIAGALVLAGIAALFITIMTWR